MPHRSFPGDCGLCHVTERWDVLRKDFSFDHEKVTGHLLQGAHAGAACLRCHNDRGPVQFYATRGCGGCHPDPHTSSLGLNCERCHDQTSWRPTGLVAEHARTRFPLFGAHAVTPCERCHPGAPAGQFRGAPVECDLCHRADLARATSPDHTASGWTTGCQRCHLPLGWDRAFVRHDFFPLSGGHAGLDCTRCHTSGVLRKIPSDCYSCHATHYQGAPNHSALGFPHTCQQCHTTTAWTPATFQHPFPLSGPHNQPCTTCHTTGSTSTFNCLGCHTATSTNGHHTGVAGYRYDSQACYQCHPTGRAD
ncbi:MAG: hypothetical protein M1376_09875 [Planctomycetes bacterium]|nr:hypothetical protein [Planctomycetota bacterium]